MSNDQKEWELDWWWIDVVEGDLDSREKQEAQWLLEKSEASTKRFESWRNLRAKIKQSDSALKLQWDGKYFEDLKDKIMNSIENDFPASRPRP